MDVSWFKTVLAPKLQRFSVEYRFFKDGDHGSLDQVIFESSRFGGEIGFWSEGWITFFIWDYENEKELLNLHLAPEEIDEKEKALNEFYEILSLSK